MTTKKEDEKKAADKVDGFIDFIVYIFRFRMKEFLALVSILLFGYILASNISYDKKNGFQWLPSVKVNVEVKK